MISGATFALKTGATASSGALKPHFQLMPLKIRSRGDDLLAIATAECHLVCLLREGGYCEGLNIDFRGISAALRLMCAVGLLSRELCNDDYPGKKANRNQYSYRAEFDAVDQVDSLFTDLRVNPDMAWTWRRALAQPSTIQRCAKTAPKPPKNPFST
jgi:hypothetical protein